MTWIDTVCQTVGSNATLELVESDEKESVGVDGLRQLGACVGQMVTYKSIVNGAVYQGILRFDRGGIDILQRKNPSANIPFRDEDNEMPKFFYIEHGFYSEILKFKLSYEPDDYDELQAIFGINEQNKIVRRAA